jgi:hypothetical protein
MNFCTYSGGMASAHNPLELHKIQLTRKQQK